jgi:hypothetical protein
MSQSGGRATRGAAQGLLGKVQLQQRKWSAAATTLLPVVNGQVGGYELVGDYATLFRQEGNNSRESLFEIQMGNVDTCGQGLCGNNVPKMVGPCGPGFCDGLPTRWYFQQFLTDSTTSGRVDPRLEATLYYYRGDTTRVYGRTWRSWRDSTPNRRAEYQDTTRLFFKKYGEYYIGSIDQNWESQINPKVLRFADVLLMYAEALNEQGQSGAAAPFVNRVRARAGLRPISAGLSQASDARRHPQGARARARARGAALARPRAAEPVRPAGRPARARRGLQHLRRRPVAAAADPDARGDAQPEHPAEPRLAVMPGAEFRS